MRPLPCPVADRRPAAPRDSLTIRSCVSYNTPSPGAGPVGLTIEYASVETLRDVRRRRELVSLQRSLTLAPSALVSALVVGPCNRINRGDQAAASCGGGWHPAQDHTGVPCSESRGWPGTWPPARAKEKEARQERGKRRCRVVSQDEAGDAGEGTGGVAGAVALDGMRERDGRSRGCDEAERSPAIART